MVRKMHFGGDTGVIAPKYPHKIDMKMHMIDFYEAIN